jgi:hypothetical protein
VTDFDEAALAIARRAYARQMLAVAGVEDTALEEASRRWRASASSGRRPVSL